MSKAEPKIVATPAPKPRRAVRRKRPADTLTSTPPVASAGGAAPATAAPGAAESSSPAAAPAKEPELGQLSAGNAADSKAIASMMDQIRALEARLAAIKQPHSSDEDTTETQVRLFLSKARQATLDNDLDGARTLTLKAKVLLDELTNL